jgi:hypothetical protein
MQRKKSERIMTKNKQQSWGKAVSALLRGEIISGKNVGEGMECYLRHQAWAHGYELQTSGVFSYKSYSFVKAA